MICEFQDGLLSKLFVFAIIIYGAICLQACTLNYCVRELQHPMQPHARYQSF